MLLRTSVLFRLSALITLLLIASLAMSQLRFEWATIEGEYRFDPFRKWGPQLIGFKPGPHGSLYLITNFEGTAPESGDGSIVKFNRNGAIEWRLDSLSGTKTKYTDTETDAAGNLIVSGSIGKDEATLAKVSPTGAVLWKHTQTSPSVRISQVTQDAQGNVYTFQQLRWPPLAKYTPLGQKLWSAGPPSDVAVSDFVVDSLGTVHVRSGYPFFSGYRFDTNGRLIGTYAYPKNGYVSFMLGSGANVYYVGEGDSVDDFNRNMREVLVSKTDSQGVEAWFREYNSVEYRMDSPNAAATDAAGNLIVLVYSMPTILPATSLTISYSPTGQLRWANATSGVRTHHAQQLVVDNVGTSYVLVRSGRVGDWSQTISTNGQTLGWAHYDYPDADRILWPQNIAVAANGDVFILSQADKEIPDSRDYSRQLHLMRYSQAPVCTYDKLQVTDGVAVPVARGLYRNDAGVQGGLAEVVAKPTRGSVTMLSGGSFKYVANAGYAGPDTFTYRVHRDGYTSNVVKVDVTVSPAVLGGLSVNPARVLGGSSAVGTLTLTRAFPSSTSVAIGDNSSAITTPSSVSVPAGATSASFNIGTSPVSADAARTVTAQHGDIIKSVSLTLAGASPLELSLPAEILGGSTATGLVKLGLPAPVGGANVMLSDNSTVLATPASVTVPAGATSSSIGLSSTNLSIITAVTVTASYNGKATSRTVKVLPYQTIASLSVSPSTLSGGSTATGTVRLLLPAGGTGVTVSMSSNSTAVQPPASVTIPTGSSSATFIVRTIPVATVMVGSITARYGTVSKSATVTIMP